MASTKITATSAREGIEAVRVFRTAYEAYLQGGPDGGGDLRRAVIRAMPAAEQALNLCGGGLVVFEPMGGNMRFQGLPNVAFLHERPGFRLSQPPIYEALLDDLDRVEAVLELAVTKIADREDQRADDQPVFCERGHFVGIGPSAPWFCEDCGGRAVSSCDNCSEPVKARAGDAQRPAAFCGNCGAALPWVDRQGRIYQLQNLLAREPLDEATAMVVREQLDALSDPALSDAEQRERWGRVKELAPGLLRSGGAIVQTLVTAQLRATLGI